MAKDASTYHPVPSVRRFREREAAKGGHHDGHHTAGFDSKTNPHGHSIEQVHGPVTKTEVEQHEDGTAHLVATHKDGHKQVHPHKNVAKARAHARAMMHGGGGGAYPHEMHGNEHEAGKQTAEEAVPGAGLEDQDIEAEGGSEYPNLEAEVGEHAEGKHEECPECGHDMKAGKCEHCGYEKAEGGHDGSEEQEEEV